MIQRMALFTHCEW